MEITIQKLTSVDLLRKAASMTTGKPSQITLKRAYALGHSLMRTQLFWVELRQIPLSVASHLVRHIHAQPYQLSKRIDRGGASFRDACEIVSSKIRKAYGDGDFNKLWEAQDELKDFPKHFDRQQPTDLGLLLNAEEIINISRVRLCAKASAETRSVWRKVVDALRDCDPDLFRFCVPACIHQGFCRERPSCGYCNHPQAREDYLKNFE